MKEGDVTKKIINDTIQDWEEIYSMITQFN
jgi:hypothetical protein